MALVKDAHIYAKTSCMQKRGFVIYLFNALARVTLACLGSRVSAGSTIKIYPQHFGEGGELDGGVRLQERAGDGRVLHEGVEHWSQAESRLEEFLI